MFDYETDKNWVVDQLDEFEELHALTVYQLECIDRLKEALEEGAGE